MQRRYFLILAIIVVGVSLTGWMFLSGWRKPKIQNPPSLPAAITPTSTIVQTSAATTSTLGFKIYRNEQWGFEFQYPEDWTFYPNTFGSPFSKFNLVGAPLGEDYQINPPVLVNIVTPDFADRAVVSRENLGALVSKIIIGNSQATKYEYIEEGIPRVSIDASLGKYRMILGTKKA